MSLQLWRKKGRLTYALVGEKVFKGLRPGRHDVTLNSRERIDFEAGDVFGVTFTRFNPIPFDATETQHCDVTAGDAMHINNPPPSLKIGDIYTFQRKEMKRNPCRLYSLFAKMETASELLVVTVPLFCLLLSRKKPTSMTNVLILFQSAHLTIASPLEEVNTWL